MKRKEEILAWLDTNPRIQDLKKFAKQLGVRLRKSMKKREVIRAIKDFLKKETIETRSSATSPGVKVEEKRVEEVKELPKTYDKDKLVLLPVNPNWLFIYWDMSPETRKIVENLEPGSSVVLRVHDVTYIIFDGRNAHRTFEAHIDVRYTSNYYINVPMPNADYLAELGYKTPYGEFVPLMRSNVARTPSNSPSPSNRERWYDLRKRRRSVFPSKGVVIKPVERVRVSSPGKGVEYSGGGAFLWESIRSGGIL
ncbi:MAG: DUF4912 domain-containing protein [Thermotogae bacterium]|nr:DUF4912 domain-containing protein [Thermotogaceae bacterium]OQX58160.1 MAG: hypothetical protein B5M49_02305 [Thermotoga sp. 4484_232]RKX38663.1 MAG: DUF4912 domain-containing protein [Thermotogota bacterium]RKX50695.1 MAG: DUF4912 domain-containing protein [Thermotogota bacterium]HDG62541.1 DUF4912 domain-containing protein [Thermotoga sp.]